ncbi:MAG: YciI family protein [Gammaproteobacteria bacterium]|nr:YciI family protein [Gammaproteobacteria bacterium]
MQFVVTALDFSDPDALDRRMQNREAHIANIQQLIAHGHYLSGGAIINEEGNMIGSTSHMEFPDRESLEKCLHSDPYIAGKVWEHIDIKAVKLVPMK